MRRNFKIILALTTASFLVSFAYATSLMNPTTQYTGEGEPFGTNFREGDTYIDTASLNVWIFNGTCWTTMARYMQPPIDGVNGTDGANGSTWFLVSQDPTTLPDFGKEGDFCLENSLLNVYYKSSGQWQLIGNIKGADGIKGTNGLDGKNGVDGVDGSDGVNGSVWYNDLAYNLSDDLGVDGDYFMFTNGTVEYKMNGQWMYFTSLMGPAGPTGATGATGATGPAGPAGTNGVNGIDGVDGTDGVDGKDGIDQALTLNTTVAVVPWWMYLVAIIAVGASAYSVYRTRKNIK